MLILFIPASCTSDLQPLDVAFNGPWKVMITKFAGKWLTENIQEQLRVDPDPTIQRPRPRRAQRPREKPLCTQHGGQQPVEMGERSGS